MNVSTELPVGSLVQIPVQVRHKRKRIEEMEKRAAETAEIVSGLLNENDELERRNKRLKLHNQELEPIRHNFTKIERKVTNLENNYSGFKLLFGTAAFLGAAAALYVGFPLAAPYLSTTTFVSSTFTAHAVIPAGTTFTLLGRGLSL
ncbi:MAG: hypothetical protein CK425_10295 [Parachlamydia sp.]|nr:MAG: hypothetical protein CK425_10295 [Parachlamydia sp.]